MKPPSLLAVPCLVLSGALLALTACRSTDTAQRPVPRPQLRAVNSPAPPPAPPVAVASAPAPALAPVTPASPAPPAAAAPASSPSSPAPAANAPAEASVAAPASTAPASAPPANAANEGVPLARLGPQLPNLAPGVRAVVDLVQAEVSTNVLLEYIQTTTNSLALESEDILYLKDIGVPEEVITAMLKRTGDERAATAAAAAEPAPAPTAPPAPTPAAQATPAAPPSTYDQTVTAPAPPAPAPPAPPPAAPPVTENYFYSALTPYGSWLYIEPYGWCWQPTVAVVDRSWRPYLHGGRWVYTSAGWYWQSYYTWGWAPFHYGNWYLSPACGWVWVPGHVWAPAWVTWRYSDAYCGWAPLPPGCSWHPGFGLTYWGSRVSVSFGFHLGWSSFVFCAWDDWWRPHPYRYCLPPHRAAVVYHQTTIINNFYVDKSRNTIVNEGVPPQAMPARVRQELRKVELADVSPSAPHQLRPERATVTGGKLAVYRPQVPPDLKLASAKPGEAPLRPLRTRQEAASPTRVSRVPEPVSKGAADRPPGHVGASPARVAPPASAPERLNPPARSETPRTGVTATPPARSGSVSNPAAPALNHRPSPAPVAPTRRETVAPAPAQPQRSVPPAVGQAPPQRIVPNRTSPPERDPAPAARPPASVPPSRAIPNHPAPPRTQVVPPATPPTRSEAPPRPAVGPAPARNANPAGTPPGATAPRSSPSAPPVRLREPDWISRAPTPAWSSPPSRSVAPLASPAPARVAPPAPLPNFRSSPPAPPGPGGGRGGEGGERSRSGRPSNLQER